MVPATAVEPVAKTFGLGVIAIVAAVATVTGAAVGFFGGKAVEPDEITEARKALAEKKKAAKKGDDKKDDDKDDKKAAK